MDSEYFSQTPQEGPILLVITISTISKAPQFRFCSSASLQLPQQQLTWKS